jgi:glycerol-3-phosphate dehydrogenase
MRYLQHADFKRMRESIRERSTLMRIAPHLVAPQPYLLPTYGHSIKGFAATALYFAIYDVLSWDRKWLQDPARRVPNSRTLRRREVLELVPGLNPQQLTGGVIWYDGQMHNTERLTLSFLLSASERGAQVANYVEVVGLLQCDNAIIGVEAKDLVGGQTITVRAKTTLNASGPWATKTLHLSRKECKDYDLHASKALSLITRPLTKDFALVFPIQPMYGDRQALVNKQESFIFAIPWRDHSLIGSLHLPCADNPECVSVSEEEIRTYIDLINAGCPTAKLHFEDVRHVLWGIIPADQEGSAAPLKHYRILDHALEDHLDGLISIVGIKYTTARDVAQKTIDLVFQKLGQVAPQSRTQHTPLWGGDIACIDTFMQQAFQQESGRLRPEVVCHLVQTYGSAYARILSYVGSNPAWGQVMPNSKVIQAEVIHAVREEMAEKLVDVVFRRTELGTLGYPGDKPLRICAQLMADELGWSKSRLEDELGAVVNAYIIRPPAEP